MAWRQFQVAFGCVFHVTCPLHGCELDRPPSPHALKTVFSALSHGGFFTFEGSPAPRQGDRRNDPLRAHLPLVNLLIGGEKDGAGGEDGIRTGDLLALQVSKRAQTKPGSEAVTAGLCGLALPLPAD